MIASNHSGAVLPSCSGVLFQKQVVAEPCKLVTKEFRSRISSVVSVGLWH